MDTGVLDAVINLVSYMTSTSITLMWEKPVSLNLTTAEPDIIYCVDVYITAESTRNHHISNCNVFEETFTFKDENPDPTDLFYFAVTPRSNVDGAKNGTAHSIDGHFSYECKLDQS